MGYPTPKIKIYYDCKSIQKESGKEGLLKICGERSIGNSISYRFSGIFMPFMKNGDIHVSPDSSFFYGSCSELRENFLNFDPEKFSRFLDGRKTYTGQSFYSIPLDELGLSEKQSDMIRFAMENETDIKAVMDSMQEQNFSRSFSGFPEELAEAARKCGRFYRLSRRYTKTYEEPLVYLQGIRTIEMNGMNAWKERIQS